jgi:hypothetical protein
MLTQKNKSVCQEIKCKDYLTDEGDPAWCYWAGQPAQVAVIKCPKLADKVNKGIGIMAAD